MPADAPNALDLTQDVGSLTRAVVDTWSVSGEEAELADLVEVALRGVGHLDTVPAADNYPSRLDGDVLHGLGAADMKGGVAVALRLAATLGAPNRDVTYVFYDGEEVEAERNGLRRVVAGSPELLAADFAVLMEPTDGVVEGGCQGTLRVEVRTRGTRAHAARAWLGDNAIHALAPLLDTLRAYEPRRPVVDGLEYHEGLQAVRVAGGVAGNVVPDEAVLTVNHRFAPDRSEDEALAHVREVFAGHDVVLTDSAPGARPGLDHPAARSFVAAVGAPPRAKHGWTDVARFSALGIPAVNYGPGDPRLAHTREEHVRLDQVRATEQRLRAWLTA